MGMDKFINNTNLENSKKFKLFCPSQWGGGNGRNTIQNVPSHLSQSFPTPSKQCILLLLFVFLSNMADLGGLHQGCAGRNFFQRGGAKVKIRGAGQKNV